MKKVISVFLILAMLISCCACGDSGAVPGPDKEEKYSFVMRQNNTQIKDIEYSKDNDGWVNKQYFQISGLKDQTIQDAINKEIEEAFFKANNWEEYPKYRGIKVELSKWEGIEPYSEFVTATQRCHVGNVLSIIIDSQLNYEKPNNPDFGSDWLYIGNNECLNYDLNTGKQLKITDVFKDGVDGLKYINDLINDKLNNTNSDEEGYYYSDGWDSFKVVGEFPGITEDQKFYISDYGDTLFIVLDDETPWAALNGYSPFYFSVDISKVSALGTKYTKENIYTDESCSYSLLNNSYDAMKLKYIDQIDEYNYMGINNFGFTKNVAYYEDMPNYMIDVEKKFIEDAQPEIDFFMNEFAIPYKDTENYNGFVTISSNIMRYGDYTTINMNYYSDASLYSLYGAYGYVSLYTSNKSKTVVFKEGQEEPVKLEDIFVPGYDYKTELGIDDSYDFEIFNDTLFVQKEGEFLSFTYNEIGCENLTIFE